MLIVTGFFVQVDELPGALGAAAYMRAVTVMMRVFIRGTSSRGTLLILIRIRQPARRTA
jgi:hypothetical protein